jgi:hypothetical protein
MATLAPDIKRNFACMLARIQVQIDGDEAWIRSHRGATLAEDSAFKLPLERLVHQSTRLASHRLPRFLQLQLTSYSGPQQLHLNRCKALWTTCRCLLLQENRVHSDDPAAELSVLHYLATGAELTVSFCRDCSACSGGDGIDGEVAAVA